VAVGDKRIFHNLDMLRGIAALAVVGRHLDGAWLRLLPGSHLAVDLFFVLSGFVLAHAYEDRLSRSMGFAAFMKLRLIRLYPLYILGSGISVLTLLALRCEGVISLHSGRFAPSLAMALVLLPTAQRLSYDTFHLYSFNFPAWSLFWELVINLVFAMIARRLSNRLLVAIIVAGAVMLTHAATLCNGLTGGSDVSNYICGAERVTYSFFVGVGLYRIWRSNALPWMRMPGWATLAVLLIIFAGRPAAWGAIYDLAMALLVLPMLVLLAMRDVRPRLQSTFTRLGIASYPIYALHAPLAGFAKAAMVHYAPIVRHAPFIPETAFLAAMFWIGLKANALYDAPLRRALSRLGQPEVPDRPVPA